MLLTKHSFSFSLHQDQLRLENQPAKQCSLLTFIQITCLILVDCKYELRLWLSSLLTEFSTKDALGLSILNFAFKFLRLEI